MKQSPYLGRIYPATRMLGAVVIPFLALVVLSIQIGAQSRKAVSTENRLRQDAGGSNPG